VLSLVQPPPAVVPVHQPGDGAAGVSYGVGPMVLGFGGPEVIGDMRCMFDEERARRDPGGGVAR
jgi:hypothetical protein